MRDKELKTRVIFVRHGETNFPLDRIYCDDREDPPLNEFGAEQAQDAAESLSGMRVAAVHASPCVRTQMTAQAIAAKHGGLNITLENSLRERHFGVWEGLYFNEIERDFPAEYLAWKKNQAAFKPEGGESVYDLLGRVTTKLNELVARYRGETIIVVAHVGPIRVLVSEAVGLPVESYRQLQIDPASVTIIDYGISQNNLILLNCHARHWNSR